MFKQYLNEQRMIERDVLAMLYVMENYNTLNEAEVLNENKINDFLAKFGLKFHKEGPGLIDYITDFVKGTGKIFVAALKGDKEEVKRIAKGVTKEKVLDFLLKLDMATLHVITGPIHMVDAITGWDLWANIENVAKKGKNMLADIWKILKDLRKKVHDAFDPNRETTIIKQIDDMEAMIPKPAVRA